MDYRLLTLSECIYNHLSHPPLGEGEVKCPQGESQWSVWPDWRELGHLKGYTVFIVDSLDL